MFVEKDYANKQGGWPIEDYVEKIIDNLSDIPSDLRIQWKKDYKRILEEEGYFTFDSLRTSMTQGPVQSTSAASSASDWEQFCDRKGIADVFMKAVKGDLYQQDNSFKFCGICTMSCPFM